MGVYIAKRLLMSIPVLLGVIILVFLMVRMVPGDPAVVMAGEQATAEQVAAIRAELHLDKPLPVQFGLFMRDLAGGDLGRSPRTHAPVSEEIGARLGNSVILMFTSLLLATVIGVATGVISAVKPYSLFDSLAMLISLIGVSMPVFWLGLMFILLFSVKLGLLPAAGTGTWLHLVLPTVCLATVPLAMISRMTRSCVLEVMGQDYIRTARAKGLPERVVIAVHALKNAFIPIVTVVGLQMGNLLGGAVLTENVFAWPGLGRLMVDSILARDYPVVQGTVLFIAVCFVFINILIDVLYVYLDARVRFD
jgi:peptide/nickel transport system permease protein